MNNSLQIIQNYFQAFLLEGEENIRENIVDNRGQASVDVRLEVYRNAYYLRLIDILAMDYPILKKILGDEKFSKIATEYIDAYPSTHFSIAIFGRHLAKFLTSCSNIDAYLAEMAAFEWKLSEVLDAKDSTILTIEDMSTIAPEEWSTLAFNLNPSLQFISFFYNIPEIWRILHDSEDEKRAEVASLYQIMKSDEPSHWMVWRFNLEAYYAPLNEQQLYMMQTIQEGKTFGEICEELCQFMNEDEVIQFAAGNLRAWVSEGIFADAKSGSPPPSSSP